MVLLESCFCCSLSLAAAAIGVYALVAYIIAFVTELWWIMETPVTLPAPAYILSFLYFILFIFAAVLLHGLSVKRTVCLLVWMFIMGLLAIPEGCLVLYMGLHHWHITTLYGLIETTSWICRLLVNIVGAICIQSLYSLWREEKSIVRHLNALKTNTFTVSTNRCRRNSQQPNHYLYQTKLSFENHGFVNSTENLKRYHYPVQVADEADGVKQSRSTLSPCIEGLNLNTIYPESQSEFNASNFDARLKNMPYLTIQRGSSRDKSHFQQYNYKPRLNLTDPNEYLDDATHPNYKRINKTTSLIDLRETNNLPDNSKRNISKSISLNFINHLGLRNEKPKINQIKDYVTLSLDRKMIKNNLLPKLKNIKLSPFMNKKIIMNSEEELNIYRVNPPKEQNIYKVNPQQDEPSMNKVSTQFNNLNLDLQLNKIYSQRGMYVFNEKFKKVNYYPPEYFNKGDVDLFKSRIGTYSGSNSRYSLGNESDDIRHISDVAL